MKILFSNNMTTTSQGRNGAVKTTAVNVSVLDFGFRAQHTMLIEPYTSRGSIANCNIEVPIDDMPALIQTMQDMYNNYIAARSTK